MNTPHLRRYTHPGFNNATFILDIPDAAVEEATRRNPLDIDKAIFNQFSQSEKDKLRQHFSARADLYKFKYELFPVVPGDLKGKTMIEGEAGRKFWI
jgi:hypothetical protein